MDLDAGNSHSFRPFPLLGGPHLQTIFSAVLKWPVEPPAATRLVALPDGDRLALEVSTPPAWRPIDPTVLLLHGLCGCHRSPYLVRLARKLFRRGLRAIRMNFRGCGSGKGLARHPYHAGRSEDLLAVLKDLRAEWPESPLTAIGFSLGGNVALKLAGELGTAARGWIRQLIAVCPPADLLACSKLLARPENRLYNRTFVRLIKAEVGYRHRRFPDLPPVQLPRRATLYELDDLYTAPQCGFKGVLDYYEKASSAPLVPAIALPCRVLFAADDPVVDASALDRQPRPRNVQVQKTARGGHLGFLGAPWYDGGFRWMDARLLEWIGAPAER